MNTLKNYDSEMNTFDFLCWLGIFGTLITGMLLSLFRVNKFQFLEGKLNGELEFKNDEIIINQRKVSITEIKHIKLDAKDYKGNWGVFSFEGNFGDAYRSNGTDNNLELELNNGEILKVKFQQLHKYQILNDKEILKNYCNQGILNYASLKDLLEFKYSY